ncbi:MAG: glutamine--fructose-6-phosphate transaminase (isomerizing) [bacterium]|nr:glutamine--fructose-6-phosphate transaminase (isomerizing) [bacterium]
MCGIIGIIGKGDIAQALVDGLAAVEYRGYDSAGVAFVGESGELLVVKHGSKGLDPLREKLSARPSWGTIGIGHTRWATHGAPSERNAHPHLSASGRIAVVHNGIVENVDALKRLLARVGLAQMLRSDTDTEVIAFLIEHELATGAPTVSEAVRRALLQVEGAYGVAVISADHPDEIVAARRGSPLVIGRSRKGEWFVGSDPAVFAKHARRVDFLEEGEMAILRRGKPVRIERLEGGKRSRASRMQTLNLAEVLSDKGGYPHFMLKELCETPSALGRTLSGRIRNGEVKIGSFDNPETANRLKDAERIVVLACGTSLFAGEIGKLLIERYARIPVEVADAAEWRYGACLVSARDAVIVISQSGETADTLGALAEAKKLGALAFGITNRVGSTLARLTEPSGMYLHAGPEIAVASTKSFACQVAALALFAAKLAFLRGSYPVEGLYILLNALDTLPKQLEGAPPFEVVIRELAGQYADAPCMLIIGRGWNAPVASEGALKLWELPYLAGAHGFAGGALKHGPIALIEPGTPVIAIVPRDSLRQKMMSNISEALARGAHVIALTTSHDEEVLRLGAAGRVRLVPLPETAEELYCIPAALALQFFAYYLAVARGTDVDKPRNLAKSVTVE